MLFFFQAGDGIRSATVTGVQTCALPISAIRPPTALPGARPRLARNAVDCLPAGGLPAKLWEAESQGRRLRVKLGIDPTRSEERRVGKEWRGRWDGKLDRSKE